jgi:hypothetical protein
MGQSSDVARANRKPFWSKAGEPPASSKQWEPDRLPMNSSPSMACGAEGVINPHNNDRASRIPDREPEKTQFHRGRMTAEANGARLSISPSDKIPSDDLPSGYNHRPRLVQSRGGEGNPALFTEAQYSSQQGL